MDISTEKLKQEVEMFCAKLSPTADQKQHLALTEYDVMKKIEMESAKSGHSVERVLLVALCGQMRTDRERAEFVTRLLLLKQVIR